MSNKICKIEGCESDVMARGWCCAHYKRWRRYGSPTAGRIPHGEPMRFMVEEVLGYKGNDCLMWPYYRNDSGYARINTKEGPRPVHRLVCIAVHGEPPSDGHIAAHECGKGHEGCVNPRHLTWKTSSENQLDKIRHGTHNRGSRHPLSKLSEEDVLDIRSMLESDGLLQKEIAELYDVCPSTIGSIKRNENWRWLKDDIDT